MNKKSILCLIGGVIVGVVAYGIYRYNKDNFVSLDALLFDEDTEQ